MSISDFRCYYAACDIPAPPCVNNNIYIQYYQHLALTIRPSFCFNTDFTIDPKFSVITRFQCNTFSYLQLPDP